MAALLWAQSVRGVTPTAWRVLSMLARCVNSERTDWDVWPSQGKLADACEVSVSTLRRHLDELEGKKLIERSQLYRASGAKSSCVYRLMVDLTMAMPDGRKVAFGGYDETPAPMRQSDASPSVRGDACPSVTGDASIEPLKKEPLKKEDSPLPPKGAGDRNLFGEPDSDEHSGFEEAIVEAFERAWGRLSAEFPRMPSLNNVQGKRRELLLSRVRERIKRDDIAAGVAVIAEMERRIRGCPFYCGETRDWSVSPDWVVGPINFNKIMERADERSLASHQPTANNAGASYRRVRELREASRREPGI